MGCARRRRQKVVGHRHSCRRYSFFDRRPGLYDATPTIPASGRRQSQGGTVPLARSALDGAVCDGRHDLLLVSLLLVPPPKRMCWLRRLGVGEDERQAYALGRHGSRGFRRLRSGVDRWLHRQLDQAFSSQCEPECKRLHPLGGVGTYLRRHRGIWSLPISPAQALFESSCAVGLRALTS